MDNNTNITPALFNGRAIRNAILKSLAEDHNLSGSLFSNSNITILVDIISYMYQSLMTNLKFAAGESMFSDTVLYENATRLAKLIGYYAQGAYPFSLIAKISNIDSNSNTTDAFSNIAANFLTTRISYGQFSYDFALVDDVFSAASIIDQNQYVRLVLGEWSVAKFRANGIKHEEFEIPKVDKANKFISQQYVNVFTNSGENITTWTYDPTPLFAKLSNPLSGDDDRLINSSSQSSENWYRFNFYLDENNQYILKFGDGITSAMPEVNDEITVVFLTSTTRAEDITQQDINAINNAEPAPIAKSSIHSKLGDIIGGDGTLAIEGIYVLPISNLAGFKPVDDVETIKRNSSQAFNRQQRVVTKSDYKYYLLEHDSTVADCLVQNNWDFISTFFGYIYNLAKQISRPATVESILSQQEPDDDNERGLAFINGALAAGNFTTIDSADANNVYIWALSKSSLGINDGWFNNKNPAFGFSGSNTVSSKIFKNIKMITEHVVEVKPIWRTYCPYVAVDNPKSTNSNQYITIKGMGEFADAGDADELLENTKTTINIYIDTQHANNAARIKTAVNRLIKRYLYEDIKLGITPSVGNLSKDILNVAGVNSLTTCYYDKARADTREVQGIQFVSWTAGNLVGQSVCFDTLLTFGLPQINPFEYLKCAIGYEEFITKFIKIIPDYSRSR